MSASSESSVSRRSHRIAGGARAYKKVSVTLPADLLDQIRGQVGRGNLSRFLTEAAEEKQRHEALDEWLARMEAEHGPVSEVAEGEADRIWRDAGRSGG
jgi:Arc/MetJ-type ribon-helix-helix transcriptional regulator